MKLRQPLLAAVFAALCFLVGGGHGAGDVTFLTSCVDTGKVARLNAEIQAHGGPLGKTKVCKTDGGPNVLRGHTSFYPAPGETRGCHQMDPTSAEFQAAGCGIFTEVSATNKDIEDAIFEALKSALPLQRPVEDVQDYYIALKEFKTVITDFDPMNPLVGPRAPPEVEAEFPALRAKAKRRMTRAAWDAPIVDLPKVVRKLRIYANQILQGLSMVASVVEPFDDEHAGPRKHAATMLQEKDVGIPGRRYRDEDERVDYMYESMDFALIIDALMNGNLAGHEMFFEKHFHNVAAKRALRCLPILHPMIGFARFRIHNDINYECEKVSKTFKKLRPACTRLAVAQLINFNRNPDIDASAPWKLSIATSAIAHAGVMNVKNTLMRAYKSDKTFKMCTNAERVGEGPRNAICQTFTECGHNVIYHLGKAYKGCKTDNVVDDPEDDEEEMEGIAPVFPEMFEVDVSDGKMVKNPKNFVIKKSKKRV